MRRGPPSPGSALTSATAPSRGGSISTLVERAERLDALRRGLEQVGGDEAGPRRQAVARGVLPGAAHQRGAAFDADDRRAAARDRQAEVAEPAEEVGDTLARLRCEQAQCTADQHPVDRRIDLRELGRRVGEAEVELRQGVGERRCSGMERRRRVRPARSAARTGRRAGRRTRRGGFASAAVGGSSTRSTSSRGRGFAVADREFDLRQAVADGQCTRRARAGAAAVPRSAAAGSRTSACRRRSSTSFRGSRPARRPSWRRGAPTAARGGGSPRPGRGSRAGPRRGARGRCATARPRAHAAWPRPAPPGRCAASCSRRRREKCGQRGTVRAALARTIRSARAIS